MMLRIIAGKHRGRKIESPTNKDIRPTAGRTREAIFNILMHSPFLPDGSSPLVGTHVVEIFCGTGAFGLEALSRGAAFVTFVDLDRKSLALAQRNATGLGEGSNVRMIQADATHLPRAREPASVIFLDPPYGSGLAPKTYKGLDEGGWLTKDSVIVVEQQAKEPFAEAPGFTVLDTRIYGNAAVRFLRKST